MTTKSESSMNTPSEARQGLSSCESVPAIIILPGDGTGTPSSAVPVPTGGSSNDEKSSSPSSPSKIQPVLPLPFSVKRSSLVSKCKSMPVVSERAETSERARERERIKATLRKQAQAKKALRQAAAKRKAQKQKEEQIERESTVAVEDQRQAEKQSKEKLTPVPPLSDESSSVILPIQTHLPQVSQTHEEKKSDEQHHRLLPLNDKKMRRVSQGIAQPHQPIHQPFSPRLPAHTNNPDAIEIPQPGEHTAKTVRFQETRAMSDYIVTLAARRQMRPESPPPRRKPRRAQHHDLEKEQHRNDQQCSYSGHRRQSVSSADESISLRGALSQPDHQSTGQPTDSLRASRVSLMADDGIQSLTPPPRRANPSVEDPQKGSSSTFSSFNHLAQQHQHHQLEESFIFDTINSGDEGTSQAVQVFEHDQKQDSKIGYTILLKEEDAAISKRLTFSSKKSLNYVDGKNSSSVVTSHRHQRNNRSANSNDRRSKDDLNYASSSSFEDNQHERGDNDCAPRRHRSKRNMSNYGALPSYGSSLTYDDNNLDRSQNTQLSKEEEDEIFKTCGRMMGNSSGNSISSNEQQPLVHTTKRTNALDPAKQSKSKTRTGSNMWFRAKNKLDTIIMNVDELSQDGDVTICSAFSEDGDMLLMDESGNGNDGDENTVAQRSAIEKKRKAVSKAQIKAETKKEFQRELNFSPMTALSVIAGYLVVAAVAYCFVFEPDWTPIDSAYFAIVTITTVGFGDITPSNDFSRVFTCFYALGGISFLGIALGVLGSNLIEAQAVAMNHASSLSQMQVMTLFGDMGKKQNRRSSLFMTAGAAFDIEQFGGMTEKEMEIQIREFENKIGEGSNNNNKTPAWMKSRLLMLLPLVVALFLVSFVIANEAGWNVSRTLYFFVTTSATIGFGDEAPTTQLGRLFAIFYIPVAVVTMGEWISAAANLIIEKRQAVFRKKYHSRELSIADLEAMDADGDNEVTRAEYLEFMLLAMNQVDRDILIELNAQFDKLDSDGTGVLDKHDLIHAAKRKLKSARRKLELASYKEKLLKIGTSQRRKKFTNDPLSKLPSFGGIRRQLSRPN